MCDAVCLKIGRCGGHHGRDRCGAARPCRGVRGVPRVDARRTARDRGRAARGGRDRSGPSVRAGDARRCSPTARIRCRPAAARSPCRTAPVSATACSAGTRSGSRLGIGPSPHARISATCPGRLEMDGVAGAGNDDHLGLWELASPSARRSRGTSDRARRRPAPPASAAPRADPTARAAPRSRAHAARGPARPGVLRSRSSRAASRPLPAGRPARVSRPPRGELLDARRLDLVRQPLVGRRGARARSAGSPIPGSRRSGQGARTRSGSAQREHAARSARPSSSRRA